MPFALLWFLCLKPVSVTECVWNIFSFFQFPWSGSEQADALYHWINLNSILLSWAKCKCLRHERKQVFYFLSRIRHNITSIHPSALMGFNPSMIGFRWSGDNAEWKSCMMAQVTWNNFFAGPLHVFSRLFWWKTHFSTYVSIFPANTVLLQWQ